MKKAFLVSVLAIFVSSATIWRHEIMDTVKSFWLEPPCSSPIDYRIARFDQKFGISKDDFLASIKKAEDVWEKALGKELFVHEPEEGKLAISLIYDERQAATDKLLSLGIIIKNDKETYLSLKAKYDALQLSFKSQKEELEDLVEAFEARRANYEKEVVYWNARGGAPREEFRNLEKERQELNVIAQSLESRQNRLNDEADTLNSLAVVINRLIDGLSLNVDKYNSTVNTSPKEFDEGEYVRDENSEMINIYEFASQDKLVRLVAHELGHALGMEHVDNPEALMYRLNQGESIALSASDITELEKLCYAN